jgi:hypothetical protein
MKSRKKTRKIAVTIAQSSFPQEQGLFETGTPKREPFRIDPGGYAPLSPVAIFC